MVRLLPEARTVEGGEDTKSLQESMALVQTLKGVVLSYLRVLVAQLHQRCGFSGRPCGFRDNLVTRSLVMELHRKCPRCIGQSRYLIGLARLEPYEEGRPQIIVLTQV